MIDIKNLSIQFTGDNLFENVNLKIARHDKIALVGSNGTGKSTFLKLLFNIEQPESGSILKQKGISIGYLPQDLISITGKNLLDEVKSSIPDINTLVHKEKEILEALELCEIEDDRRELIEELGDIHNKKEDADFYSLDSKIEKVLIGLGFKQRDFYRMTNEFSGGWQMRIQLAKILLAENDLILLDEPTNHLDIDTLSWFEQFLQNFKNGLIIVSHDRHFINAVTNKTLEVFDNQINFFNGNYEAYLIFKQERELMLKAAQKSQEKKIKETENFIERFRYKATKAKQVQSRIKQLEKLELISISSEEKQIEIRFPEPPQSGILPVELINISHSYGNIDVLNNINLNIERGDKIAIVGPNGAGKTTLAKIIGSKLKPSSGKIIYGHNTIVSYYEQEVADALDPEDDLIDTLEKINNDLSIGSIRSLLGSFLFSGDDVFKKIKVLSGGEKSRATIAQLLLTKSNLIILDEPTNHLDFSSKNVLQSALINYSGTLIIVSHDIDFLIPITNKVIELREQDLKVFLGGIDYYLYKKNNLIENKIHLNDKSANKSSRKDQKRIEAEIRQHKYSESKDLTIQLKVLENKIKSLEDLKMKLEAELIDPAVFSNPETAKEKNIDYERTKQQLENEYTSWTQVSSKLEEIEKKYNNISGD